MFHLQVVDHGIHFLAWKFRVWQKNHSKQIVYVLTQSRLIYFQLEERYAR